MKDSGPSVVSVLFAENWQISLHMALFMGSLGLLAFISAGFTWFADLLSLNLNSQGQIVLTGLVVVSVLAALTNGYLNDDLVVGLGIGFAPFTGVVVWNILVAGELLVSGTTSTGYLIGTAIGGMIGGCCSYLGVWYRRKKNLRPEIPP